MNHDILRFYRGEGGNIDGNTLAQIMTWDNGMLEFDHSYVQWMFPSNEPSSMNADAPVMDKETSQLFKSDPELQEKLKQSFIRFLDFLGFELKEDSEQIVIKPLEPTKDRPDPIVWLKFFNHNMLRVTRLLKSLRLAGLSKYAIVFALELMSYQQYLSQNTLSYWRSAAFGPLWPEEEPPVVDCDSSTV